MNTMGCGICRVKRVTSAPEHGSWEHEPPLCSLHPERVMVSWEVLESRPDDKWLGLILNDRYELTRPLGQGGFGSVYLGVQRGHIRRPVAIKLLTRESPEYLALFRDEMRVVSRLSSPHTVRYLDSGTHITESGRELTYMVMNLVEGETLAQRIIRGGVLKPLEVLSLLKQTSLSLQEAHALGIVHRDLKPLNLMVSNQPNLNHQARQNLEGEGAQDLHVVVLDFGVARLMEQTSRDATKNRIMGTPYYLAPETLTDHSVTPLTDLFSLAVIAYEALCCRSPFLNEDLSGIEPYLKLRKLYRAGTKPEPLPSHLSREWTLFFECALAIDPAARFPDASAMRAAVEALEAIELERAQEELIAMRERGPTLMLPQIDLDFETDEATTMFKRYHKRSGHEGEEPEQLNKPKRSNPSPSHDQLYNESSILELSEVEGLESVYESMDDSSQEATQPPFARPSPQLSPPQSNVSSRVAQLEASPTLPLAPPLASPAPLAPPVSLAPQTPRPAASSPRPITSRETSAQRDTSSAPIASAPVSSAPISSTSTAPHEDQAQGPAQSSEYLPTVQLSRAQFRELSPSHDRAQAKAREEHSPHLKHQQRSTDQIRYPTPQRPRGSFLGVFLQIILMVSLGAMFAYFMIHYVIK